MRPNIDALTCVFVFVLASVMMPKRIALEAGNSPSQSASWLVLKYLDLKCDAR